MDRNSINFEEVANALLRVAAGFDDVEKQWSSDLDTDSSPSGDDDGIEAYEDLLDKLAPRTKRIINQAAHKQHQKDQFDLDNHILAECRELAARAGRLTIRIIDYLALDESVRSNALSINLSDDDAISRYWWDELALVVLGHKPMGSGARPIRLKGWFGLGSQACRRIAEILQRDSSQVELPNLSVKGLVDAGLGSRTALVDAAKAAGVKRANQGQHGFKFAPEDVYRIGCKRAESRRLTNEQRVKWNKLLASIGQPTLDDPRRATKRVSK